HAQPQDPGGEESGHEEVDVLEPVPGVDGATEYVPEHEQEQCTLDRSQQEQLGRAEELEDGSLGTLQPGGREASAGGARYLRLGADISGGAGSSRHRDSRDQAASADRDSASVSGSVGSRRFPVTARKTSSRLGRRSPTSSTSMPRSSSRRTMS